MKTKTPKFGYSLLARVLRDEILEDVLGDLEEKFHKTAREKSIIRAHVNHWFQIINYLRPFAIRKRTAEKTFLLRSNIKLGWRQLKNQPMFSGIKIGGLALSIAACILITLFIKDELSYDKHFSNKERLYRLYWSNEDNGSEFKVVWNSPPLADVLRNEVPEIESIARINVGIPNGAGGNEIALALTEYTEGVALTESTEYTEKTYEEGFIYADTEIIKTLGLNFIYGNAKTALTEPMTMIITKRKAEKYFGNENPVGKMIVVGNEVARPFRIDGVIDNPPMKSHLQYDFIMTMTNREFHPGEQQMWSSAGWYVSYVLLHNNADLAEVCNKMSVASRQHMRADWSDGWLQKYSLGLQPIGDVHLYSTDIRGPQNKGDIRFIWLFGGIAAAIVLIACINFINLSTARSANRAKEVGLRKTIGSSRGYLINQFLAESIIFSLFAFIAGVLLAWIFLPSFNQLADRQIEFPWNDWRFIPTVVLASIVVGTIAGLYPAFYLSSFRPIDVLKGIRSTGSKSSILRSTLVVFQFTTSIVLIVSTAVIYKQVDFMLNHKPGFDKEQVLLLHGTKSLSGNQQSLKQELIRLPSVSSVAISDFLPVNGTDVKRMANAFWVGGEEKNSDTQTRVQIWSVDHDYIQTMGMKLVSGRNFNPNLISDSSSIIINQTCAQKLGLEDPIGKQIVNDKTWNIIGVVEDFNYESLRTQINPLSMVLGNSPGIVSVKIAPGEMISNIASIEKVWRQFAPDQSIRYSFLDDNFNMMYDDVRRTGRIFTDFAILAMAVACLGLFALSAFMIEQRGKEISIRLLFGATLQKIFGLLTADFLKLILISIVFAMPIAFSISKRWLEGFHYRVELTWDVFVVTGLIGIGVAMMTVGYQSIRAGLANPVDKLRSE